MRLEKIPYITLWSTKFAATVSFYKDTLDLPVEFEDENFAQFNTSGAKLYIHRNHETRSLRDNTVEIHFQVADVDQTHNELAERGVAFEHLPQNMPWGSRMAAFRDPEGYTVEIVGPLKEEESIINH